MPRLGLIKKNSGMKRGCKHPIYSHFSTHQEFLGPLMSMFREDRYNYRRVEPTSSLLIELYEKCEDEKEEMPKCKKIKFVKLQFMEDYHTNHYNSQMELKEWIKLMQDKLLDFNTVMAAARTGEDRNERHLNMSKVCETSWDLFEK